MLDIKARAGVGRIIGPLIRWMARTRITPTWITIAGLLVMVAGGVLIGYGYLIAGLITATAGALLDAIDGPLARATMTVSKRGAFVDTVSDRVGEIAIFVGIAYHFAGDATVMALCAASLGAALAVPYVRAKAEGWGADGTGGLMGRAERLILLLLGVGLEGIDVEAMEIVLWVFVSLTALTVMQRIYRTWVQLTE